MGDDFRKAEATSVPITLFILVLAFGAMVAAGCRSCSAHSRPQALGVAELLSHVLHVEQSITSVILCIGLAVGIDYSLFYVRRAREERARTHRAEALETAATSGRAVLISGFTVMIAMMEIFLMGDQGVHVPSGCRHGAGGRDRARRLADRAARCVIETQATASTEAAGLDRLRAEPGESRFCGTDVGAVLRRPVLWGRSAAALLIALAIPAFSLHTVNPGMQGLPPTFP